MDYFNDLLTMFLDLDHVRILAVYLRVRELLEFIKNILICVLKINQGLTDLERHEGEELMTEISFWLNCPFKVKAAFTFLRCFQFVIKYLYIVLF